MNVIPIPKDGEDIRGGGGVRDGKDEKADQEEDKDKRYTDEGEGGGEIYLIAWV